MKRKIKKVKKEKKFISGNENTLFNQKEILDKQKKLNQIFEECKKNDTANYYSKVKYQQNILKIGDYLEIYSFDICQSYVVQLKNIIEVSQHREKRPFIEVEWMMKKHELPQEVTILYKKYEDYISNSEVFPSGKRFCFYVESIKNQCHLLSAEEYGELGFAPENFYFSRSKLVSNGQNLNEPVKTFLDPQPSEWPSECECSMPINPDMMYISCQSCQKWFHNQCVLSRIVNHQFLCRSCLTNSHYQIENLVNE